MNYKNHKIKKFRPAKGFTLIELLVVIAVLAILASIVFVVLDPLARFQAARNSKRWTAVNAILSAIQLYLVDNNTVDTSFSGLSNNTYYQIGTASSGCDTTCSNPSVDLNSACVDFTGLVETGHLSSVPIDPNASGASAAHTGYYVIIYSNNKIAVGSCHEEPGASLTPPTIEVSR